MGRAVAVVRICGRVGNEGTSVGGGKYQIRYCVLTYQVYYICGLDSVTRLTV